MSRGGGEKRLQWLPLLFEFGLALEQQHQVDIGGGVEFAPAIAPHCHQHDPTGVAEMVAPGTDQQLIDQSGTGADQLIDRHTLMIFFLN